LIATNVKLGVDVNARDDDGETALMWASLVSPNPDVVATLLKLGADARLTDKGGEKAINWIDRNGRLKDKDTDVYWELHDAVFENQFEGLTKKP
jgi:ankyrin repeat protein